MKNYLYLDAILVHLVAVSCKKTYEFSRRLTVRSGFVRQETRVFLKLHKPIQKRWHTADNPGRKWVEMSATGTVPGMV